MTGILPEPVTVLIQLKVVVVRNMIVVCLAIKPELDSGVFCKRTCILWGTSDDLWPIARQIEDIDRASFSSSTPAKPRATHSSNTGVSSLINDDKKFQVTLAVTHLKPEELEITTKDDRLLIHGKHKENKDDHGYVKREFTRAYWLPKVVNLESFKSNLSLNGLLSIGAAKVGRLHSVEHNIPIKRGKK
ncbi:HSP20 domain containing protein [Trichuris trichiura]|uniref:HSP20 domain containing protein n=1 Tax=Trichuris trichiura TaxID=36087 RepID=A0A077ZDN8_TRITR|nr:HSP20 domain containing protein [Trichuris trichiura]